MRIPPICDGFKTVVRVDHIDQLAVIEDGVMCAIGFDDRRDRTFHKNKTSLRESVIADDGGGSNVESFLDCVDAEPLFFYL